jgi:hypothetical protein
MTVTLDKGFHTLPTFAFWDSISTKGEPEACVLFAAGAGPEIRAGKATVGPVHSSADTVPLDRQAPAEYP